MTAHDDGENPIYDTLIMEYTCGALDRSLSLLVASHMTLSPAARRRAALLERLGGALIAECCPPVPMSERSLHAVLDRLSEEACADRGRSGACPDAEGTLRAVGCRVRLPQPLIVTLTRVQERRPRWRWAAPGAAIMAVPLPRDEAPRRQAFLFRARPGTRLPRHTHDGAEFTLVLEGGFHDENGCYVRGDLLIMETGTAHRPVADAVQGCVLLMVTEKGFGLPAWLAALAGIR